jgi:hypothetical protein
MNGGHYLTKGHVILCLLYIKTSKDVKKYFGTLEKPFSDANSPLLKGRFATSTPGVFDGSSAADKLPLRKQRGIGCHSVLDTESSFLSWIPAFAGMT